MALHAAPPVQLLLENLFQFVQFEAAHRQRAHSVTRRHLLTVRKGGQKQVVFEKALGHRARGAPQEGQSQGLQGRSRELGQQFRKRPGEN